MKMNFRVIEPNAGVQLDGGLYQEIAIYVRDLLRCDYGLVALLENDALRLEGIAGRNGVASGNMPADLMSRLRNFGPELSDDARLLAAPVSYCGRVVGLLAAYSSQPRTFTTHDLEKLMVYTHVAAGIIANDVSKEDADMRTNFTTDDLRHFFRLITMGELSASFAHEVRNPLMLIRGHLRSMDATLGADHPLRTNFEAIERASIRIEEMGKRMLDFSRKRTRRPEPSDVADLIWDALHFIQPYMRPKFIDVQVQLEPHLPTIDVERWQMLQAIVNLLQNAADAMADVDQRVLSITAGIQQNHLQIVISDSGTGIAPADLPKIFEPFFSTKGDRGTGLGLFITKQVVQEHGGTVAVETSDRRTSFHISLPL
jgi:signal transduction histidine kinase